MPRRSIDRVMASLFHMDWLVPLDTTTEDDLTRAVAERSEHLLRAARFMRESREAGEAVDVEVRVWVEAAQANACVSITWEPGVGRYAFHLLDESLTERLGCVVFHELPCLDAEDSAMQQDLVVNAALEALAQGEGTDLDEVVGRIRAAQGYTRVSVTDDEKSE